MTDARPTRRRAPGAGRKPKPGTRHSIRLPDALWDELTEYGGGSPSAGIIRMIEENRILRRAVTVAAAVIPEGKILREDGK